MDDPQSIMHRAMQVRWGEISALDSPVLFERGGMAFARDGFSFTTPGGIKFQYERGEPVTAMMQDGASEQEFELFLWGTVYGAIAWVNELFPLHASAIETDGRAIGFSAPSGGGKSTIAAALAAKGHALICDDTLVLAPSHKGLLALPDGKPMKLWTDTLKMLDMQSRAQIAAVPGKHFAEVPLRSKHATRMDHLVFLEEGKEIEIEDVKGSSKLDLISSALYREELHVARQDHEAHGMMMLDLASAIDVSILRRPLEPESLEVSTDSIIRHLAV